MTFNIYVKKLHPDAKLPVYGSEEASGADLYSVEEVIIPPGQRRKVSNGIAIQPDKFCDIQVRPRSGLADKHGITILNSPGTIDTDFRGEMKCVLHNAGQKDFKVEKGMRIAQMVAISYFYDSFLCQVKAERAHYTEVLELNDTKRSTGGFGSTGLS